MVHATNYFPKNGVIKSDHDVTDSKRNTVHTALNGRVGNHSFGNWDNRGIIILDPLSEHIDQVACIYGVDTFTYGSIKLSDKATILIDSSKFEKIYEEDKEYIDKNKDRIMLYSGDSILAVENALSMLGYVTQKCGNKSWEDSKSNDMLNNLVQKQYPDKLNVEHDYTPHKAVEKVLGRQAVLASHNINDDGNDIIITSDVLYDLRKENMDLPLETFITEIGIFVNDNEIHLLGIKDHIELLKNNKVSSFQVKKIKDILAKAELRKQLEKEDNQQLIDNSEIDDIMKSTIGTERLSNEQQEILRQQIARYMALSSQNGKINPIKVDSEGKFELQEGDLIHVSKVNNLDSIAQKGILTGQAVGIKEFMETYFCSDFFRAPKNESLSTFTKNFKENYTKGLTSPYDMSKPIFGSFDVAFIVSPTEENKELLSYDPYTRKDNISPENTDITKAFVNEKGLLDGDGAASYAANGGYSSILYGVPANQISTVMVGNGWAVRDIDNAIEEDLKIIDKDTIYDSYRELREKQIRKALNKRGEKAGIEDYTVDKFIDKLHSLFPNANIVAYDGTILYDASKELLEIDETKKMSDIPKKETVIETPNADDGSIQVIDVSKIDTEIQNNEARVDSNIMNMSYKGYNTVYKATSNVESVINKIVTDNKGGKVLLELNDTRGLTSENLSKLPSNVMIRVLGDYGLENFKGLKSNDSALHTLDNATYTIEQLQKIMKVIADFEKGINPNWNDASKAKYAYDFVNDRFEYTAKTGGNLTRESHFDGLTNLIDNISTCQGFSHTYRELLTRMGIKCYEISGKIIGGHSQHVFTVANLDGKTVIVDPTRNRFNDDYYRELEDRNTTEERRKELEKKIKENNENFSDSGFIVDKTWQYIFKSNEELQSDVYISDFKDRMGDAIKEVTLNDDGTFTIKTKYDKAIDVTLAGLYSQNIEQEILDLNEEYEALLVNDWLLNHIDNIDSLIDNDPERQQQINTYLTKISKRLGTDVETFKKVYAETFRRIIDESEIGIRISNDSLSKILDSGEIKNNHTTESKRLDNSERRKQHEEYLFGIPQQVDGRDSPVYGMIFPKYDANDSNSVKFYETGPGYWYGNSDESAITEAVIILKKDAVLDNTTFTNGDTLEHGRDPDLYGRYGGIQAPVNGKNPSQTNSWFAFKNIKTIDDLRNATLYNLSSPNEYDTNSYIEAQIYGRYSHTIDNIDHIVFLFKPSNEIIEKLNSLGIKYEISSESKEENNNLDNSDLQVIDVSQINIEKQNKSIFTYGVDPNVMNMSYKGYDTIYKASSNVESVINKIVTDNKGGKVLLELNDTRGLTSENLSKLPSNVMIRVLGDYGLENFKGLKSNDSALHTLDNATYTIEQLQKIMKVIDDFEKGINPNMNNMSKALLAYSFIMSRIEYTDIKGNATRESYYDGLTCLIDNVSTSQGFAHAYRELLTRMGIKCTEISGTLKGIGQHAFNVVNIDDGNIIVDTTRELLGEKYKGLGFGVENISEYRFISNIELFDTLNTMQKINLKKAAKKIKKIIKQNNTKLQSGAYFDVRNLFDGIKTSNTERAQNIEKWARDVAIPKIVKFFDGNIDISKINLDNIILLEADEFDVLGAREGLDGFNNGKVSIIRLPKNSSISNVYWSIVHELLHQVSCNEFCHFKDIVEKLYHEISGFEDTTYDIMLDDKGKNYIQIEKRPYEGLNEAVTDYFTGLIISETINGEIVSGYYNAVQNLKKILSMDIEGFDLETLKKGYLSNDKTAIRDAIDKVAGESFFENELCPAFNKSITRKTYKVAPYVFKSGTEILDEAIAFLETSKNITDAAKTINQPQIITIDEIKNNPSLDLTDRINSIKEEIPNISKEDCEDLARALIKEEYEFWYKNRTIKSPRTDYLLEQIKNGHHLNKSEEYEMMTDDQQKIKAAGEVEIISKKVDNGEKITRKELDTLCHVMGLDEHTKNLLLDGFIRKGRIIDDILEGVDQFIDISDKFRKEGKISDDISLKYNFVTDEVVISDKSGVIDTIKGIESSDFSDRIKKALVNHKDTYKSSVIQESLKNGLTGVSDKVIVTDKSSDFSDEIKQSLDNHTSAPTLSVMQESLKNGLTGVSRMFVSNPEKNIIEVLNSLKLNNMDKNIINRYTTDKGFDYGSFLNYALLNLELSTSDIKKLYELDDIKEILKDPQNSLLKIKQKLDHIEKMSSSSGIENIDKSLFSYLSFLVNFVARDMEFRVEYKSDLCDIARKLGDLATQLIESKCYETSYKDVKIVTYGEDTDFLTNALKKVISIIDQLPRELICHLKNIKRFVIYDTACPNNLLNLLRKEEYLYDPHEHSFITTGEYYTYLDIIKIYKTGIFDNEVFGTIAHELGHAMDNYMVTALGTYFSEELSIWRYATLSDYNSVSEYGDTHISEDFAEMCSVYAKALVGEADIDEVENDYPERLKVLKALFDLSLITYNDNPKMIPFDRKIEIMYIFDGQLENNPSVIETLLGREFIEHHYNSSPNVKISFARYMFKRRIINQFISLFINEQYLKGFNNDQLLQLYMVYDENPAQAVILGKILEIRGNINIDNLHSELSKITDETKMIERIISCIKNSDISNLNHYINLLKFSSREIFDKAVKAFFDNIN